MFDRFKYRLLLVDIANDCWVNIVNDCFVKCCKLLWLSFLNSDLLLRQEFERKSVRARHRWCSGFNVFQIIRIMINFIALSWLSWSLYHHWHHDHCITIKSTFSKINIKAFHRCHCSVEGSRNKTDAGENI